MSKEGPKFDPNVEYRSKPTDDIEGGGGRSIVGFESEEEIKAQRMHPPAGEMSAGRGEGAEGLFLPGEEISSLGDLREAKNRQVEAFKKKYAGMYENMTREELETAARKDAEQEVVKRREAEQKRIEAIQKTLEPLDKDFAA